ncbi:hypothetical protein [Streptomyces atratus]
MDPTTARHIRSATALPADALAVLDQASSAGGTRAARVPASEHSAIDHAVASALLLRVDELNQVREGLLTQSKSACAIAARAVHKRGKLTEDQHRAVLDPFTAAGVAELVECPLLGVHRDDPRRRTVHAGS